MNIKLNLMFITLYLKIGHWNFFINGATLPMGDINLLVGEELNITCTSSSPNITWLKENSPVDKKYITSISQYVLQLYIPSTTINDTAFYVCNKIEKGGFEQIGKNVVTVGYPPLANVTINCTSYNFKRIQCKWNGPPQPANNPTKWKMEFLINDKWYYACNSTGFQKLGCQFSPSDNQSLVMPILQVRLFGTNDKFGNQNQIFNISQYENVILEPPSQLEYLNINSQFGKVSWKSPIAGLEIKDKDTLPLNYKIVIKNKWKPQVNFTSEESWNLYNMIPNTCYNISLAVRLKIRSHINSWSNMSSLQICTSSTVPSGWEAVTPGSFQEVFSDDKVHKNVTIYFKGLQPEKHNGNNFKYEIAIVENDELITNTKPVTTFYNLQVNINYTIKISANNIKGSSKNSSFLFIHANSNDIENPIVCDLIQKDNNFYTVFWYSPYTLSTIFWCAADWTELTLPNPSCIYGINWAKVQCKKKFCKFLTPKLKEDSSERYYFGVSSSHLDVSSGIVWSQSIISQRKVPTVKKLKSIVNQANCITWMLGCEDRFKSIEGFAIYSEEISKETNIANKFKQFVAANPSYQDKIASYSVCIKNLQPGRNYSVCVKIISDYLKEDCDNNITLYIPNVVSSSSQSLIIILPTSIGLSLLVIFGYMFYKRFFSERLRILKNIQPPRGLINPEQMKDQSNSTKDIKEDRDSYLDFHSQSLEEITRTVSETSGFLTDSCESKSSEQIDSETKTLSEQTCSSGSVHCQPSALDEPREKLKATSMSNGYLSVKDLMKIESSCLTNFPVKVTEAPRPRSYTGYIQIANISDFSGNPPSSPDCYL